MTKLNKSTLVLCFVLAMLMGMGLAVSGCDEPDPNPSDAVVHYVVMVTDGGDFKVEGGSDSVRSAVLNPVDVLQQTCDKWDGLHTRHDNKVVEACDKAYDNYVRQYTGCGCHITCKVAVWRKITSTTDPEDDVKLTTYTFDVNPAN